jgi:hypothetical protein
MPEKQTGHGSRYNQVKSQARDAVGSEVRPSTKVAASSAITNQFAVLWNMGEKSTYIDMLAVRQGSTAMGINISWRQHV